MFDIIPERFTAMSDKLDTNYHDGKFELEENRPLKFYLLAKEKLDIDTTPTITGPFRFLKLAKGYKKEKFARHLLEASSLVQQNFKEA
jgi:5-methyltetrahydropteroyltriglutamate--homocysteine methyltransferase